MNNNTAALAIFMVLSTTAHADMQTTNHSLNIKGSVVVDSCAFEDETDGQVLSLELDEVSVANVKKQPTSIQNSLSSNAKNTLVCPAGIASVDLKLAPETGKFTGDIMHNIASENGASGIGFKVAAAFGQDLGGTPTWVDFATPPTLKASLDADRKIAINFGASYALINTMDKASAGAVEANLPFSISYL